MKIVHLINGLGRGGGERLLCGLVAAMCDRHEIEVFCLTRGGPLASELEERGIRVTELRRRGLPVPSAWRHLYGSVRCCDVVHSHFFYSDMTAAGLELGVRIPRLVSTRHDTGYWMRTRHRRAERHVYARFGAVLCVSAAVRRRMLERGARAEFLYVVPPGLRVPQILREPDRRNVVVSVGRLERVKGHEVMLCALAQMPRPVELVILGEGSRGVELRAQARRLGVASRSTL